MSETRGKQYFIIEMVEFERFKTRFHLDGQKNGGSQIVFNAKDGIELQQVLLGIFESGRKFAFERASGVIPISRIFRPQPN